MVRRLYGGRVVVPFGWLMVPCAALCGFVAGAGLATGGGGGGGDGAEGFSLQMSLLYWCELSCSFANRADTLDSRGLG